MSKDKQSGPGADFSMSPEDEAFLRMVEDSYDAMGKPKDQAGADRVWGKLEGRLAPAPVASIDSARPRSRKGLWIASLLGAAAAVGLFLNLQRGAHDPAQKPDTLVVRGGGSGFQTSIKVYAQQGHVKVKAQADDAGFVALFKQNPSAGPAFVTNLAFKKDQGETSMLDEESSSGTRYCVVGAKTQEELKQLIGILPDIWNNLPPATCATVP